MNIILIFSFCMGFSNPKKTNIDPPTNDPGCTVDVTLNHLSCKTEGVSSDDGSISVVATVTSGTTAIKWTSNTTSTLVPNKWEQLDLMAGEYTIEVFHQGTSVYKKTHVLQAPDNFEATIVKTDNHCYQGEDGSIAITATGGTPPYLYSIDDGQTYHSSSVFQQLPKEDYKVKIKDIKGCMITKNVSISQGAYLSVNHPPDLEVADCLNQEDIDLAFQEWLDKFVYYGGTKPLQENFSHQAIPSPCGGSIKVTYTVVDDCGVEKSCEATFTVPQKATLNFTTQAQPLTISCEENTQAIIQQWLASNGHAEASSNCSLVWTNDYTDQQWDNSCENSKSITVNFTASNGCENQQTSAIITVEDKQAPIFTEALPEDLTVSCQTIPEPAILTAADNCDQDVSVVFEETQSTDGCLSTITRIWTSTDCAGNTAKHTQIITVEDKQAPIFAEALPEDLTVSCQTIPEPAILTAADNCDQDVSVVFEETQSTDGCLSTITRIWTSTDCAGNTAKHTQIITVEDKQAPIFAEALPEDLTVSCQTIPEPTILTATDNCDQDVSVVFEETQSTDGCLSTITRIWTSTDCAGNTAKHTQTITVEDKQAPIFAEALPEDLTVSCQTIPEPAILTAADNCDQDVSVVFEETQSTDGCLSTITRIWTATDCAGNTAKHTQTITVEDKQAPIFAEALPEDLTIGCQTIPEPTILTATDNCDQDVSVVFEETQSTDGCLSTITRIWTATDCAGNTAKHTQIIVKNQDQQPPKLAAVSEGYKKDITISCGLIPPAPKLEFTDNCTGELTQDYSENSTAIQENGSYKISRLWKVSDPCGNTAEFNQTIHVKPNRNLSFNQLPADLTVNCGEIPEPEILIATTGCNTSVPVTLDEQFSQTDCTHLIERTWSATDDHGTVISHTQTITIEDRQAPVFVEPLPEDLTLNCTSLPEAVVLTAVDQCDENVMVHMEETTSLNGCTENIKRVWTATDCSGNSVSYTQNIKLLHDSEPPVLTDTSIEHFQTTVNVSCSNIPEVPDLEFQDQCSEKLQINFEENSTYVNDQTDYEIHRIWTVSDPCKNQATFTQTINVTQGNTQSELEQLMLCQQDVVYDLNNLLPPDSDLSGQWTLITDHPYLNGSFFDPTAAELGAYQAHYTLENSCTPQRIVTITVHDDCVVLACDSSDSISISKAITPNGDAYNEYFTVSGLEECGFKLELSIFNRWGNKIFESMDYQNNWNAFSNSGSSHFVPAGTYYYILTVVDSGYDPIKGYLYVGTTAK